MHAQREVLNLQSHETLQEGVSGTQHHASDANRPEIKLRKILRTSASDQVEQRDLVRRYKITHKLVVDGGIYRYGMTIVGISLLWSSPAFMFSA